MLERRELFPHVIELNHQARRRFGCSVYLVHDGSEWLLIDIGYEDTVDEIIEMIRMMDFPLAGCKYLVASHADVDHVQGFHRALELLPSAKIVGHSEAARLLKNRDRLMTYAEIPAQNISIDLPEMHVSEIVKEGDHLQIGDLSLEVWHTPGHTHGQLAFRLGELLFSGDNLFRDGCVGNIDAHHGSNIPDFIRSLERIRDSDVTWLLPSHGPVFRRQPEMIQKTIDRLESYQHMADFGTCAVDWPLLEEWEQELVAGVDPRTYQSEQKQS
jgi:hydroxyacylglutathione hydrolase